MRLTVLHLTATGDQQTFQLEVPSDMAIADFKGLIEADTGIPAPQQLLTWQNRSLTELSTQTLDAPFPNTSARLSDDEIITVSTQRPVAQRQGAPQFRKEDAEPLRQQCLGSPQTLNALRQQAPVLAEAVGERERFREIYEMIVERTRVAEEQKREAYRRLYEDPLDPESQRAIEEMIRKENVQDNLNIAFDQIPESFTTTTMLYIPVLVNGHRILAFVDSGAQATIMSADCAARTGLTRLIDRSYAGTARGVGTAPIAGRVHVAILSIAKVALHCSFTVMEGKNMDLLLGLDMLKRHRANINLGENCLEIAGEKVRFLPENEIPGNEGVLGPEPLVEGPGGAKIGGRSGAVVRGEGQGGGQGETSAAQKAGAEGAASKTAAAARAGSATGAGAGATASGSGSGSGQAQAGSGPSRTQGGFPRESIEAVMGISGVSEREAVSALSAANGDVDGAVGMFFGD